MVQTLEQYVAEATNAYKPAANAVQSQIDSLQRNLNSTNESINRDYAQQQANLNLASNQAAEAASMSAAGNGGSFGGAGNLARRKYYEQTFVPAVTQLQTNRANDLAAAQRANENTRLQLNQQLANIESQAANQALQQYNTATEAEAGRTFQAGEAQKTREHEAQQAQISRDFQANQSNLDREYQAQQAQLNREWQDYLADKQYKNEAVEAEKVRQFQEEQARLDREYQAEQARLNQEFQAQQAQLDRDFQAQQNAASRAIQRQQINSSNAYNEYLMRAAQQQQQNTNNGLKNWDFGGGYSIQALPNGQAAYYKNGQLVSAGQFLEGTGASGAKWDLWNDVWRNGVSTNGVGSDTVEAFNRVSPTGGYGYLY